MCGRYVLRSNSNIDDDPESWADLWRKMHFDAEQEDRFNIGPDYKNPAPVLTADGAKDMVFGLKPHWAKSSLINAKSEGIPDSRYWAPMAKTRPCLIPAHGFYEPKGAKGTKRPWYGFELKEHKGFFMAGLWTHHKEEKYEADSFVILTKRPNKVLADIHHRMPVILTNQESEVCEQWLDTAVPMEERLAAISEHREIEGLVSFPVSDAAKSMKNQGPELFQPI